MPRNTDPVDITPNPGAFWATQGHHFDSFTQAVNEFLDNSIANFAAHPELADPTIVVRLQSPDTSGNIFAQVVDSGTGISDIAVAFRVGDTSMQDGEPSEHGVGLKHALAYLDARNSSWTVATRTATDRSEGVWYRVSAPFAFQLSIETVSDSIEEWPGLVGSTGTVISFSSPLETFRTVARGVGGNIQTFSTLVDYFREDLSFTYSGIIQEGAHFRLMVDGQRKPVEVLEPTWVQYVAEVGQLRDEDAPWNPTLKLDATFGVIKPNEGTKRRYRAKMSSSGLQIRINGRVIEDNIFQDVWGLEKHNSYNNFLAIINLRPSPHGTRPQTVSTKNKFRRDDPEVIQLFAWIRNVLPQPPKQTVRSTDEKELRDDLKRILLSSHPDLPASARCDTEFGIYARVADVNAPAVDLRFFNGQTTTLIECKIGAPKALDVYQLVMQWDGAVHDDHSVHHGWLVADSFSDGIAGLVESINSRTDARGVNYNIQLRRWAEWFPDRA